MICCVLFTHCIVNDFNFSFETILGRSGQRLRERVEFIGRLQDTSTTRKWLKEELRNRKSISLYTKAEIQDIPVLLEVIQKLGVEVFEEA